MQQSRSLLKILGGFFFSLGILMGFIVCGVMVWGDLEASMFTNGLNGDTVMRTLKCPVIITDNETGTITATLKNPADRDSDRFFRAFVSEGYASLAREIKAKVPLPANGKNKVEWKISGEDAAFERVVLVRVYINAKYPYPSMSGNCGVIKVNIPWMNGKQIFMVSNLAAVTFLGTGAALWEAGIKPAKQRTRARTNALYFLVATLFITALLSYLGLWMLGLFGITIAVILVGVIVLRC
jgi:hypothetical protein